MRRMMWKILVSPGLPWGEKLHILKVMLAYRRQFIGSPEELLTSFRRTLG